MAVVFNAPVSYVTHVYTYSPEICTSSTGHIYGICAQLGCDICSGTYLPVTGEVEVAVGFVFGYICKNIVSICAHVTTWQCELYSECDSHICSVMYVKYMQSAPCWMVGASDLLWHNMYIHCLYMLSIWYIWYVSPSGGHSFCHIFVNNRWSRNYSWLYFVLYVQYCWTHRPI